MQRLPLRELEDALQNPTEYRNRLSSGQPRGFGATYFGALRQAIFKLHMHGADVTQVADYLSDRLSRFKDQNRMHEMINGYYWYVHDYLKRGVVTFEAPSRISLTLASLTAADLVCSGEVSRLDLRPLDGYAAWLFRYKDPENWRNELRMPLTQLAVSQKLNVPSDEITVGIYSFREMLVEERCFSREDILNATAKLAHLITQLEL